jgi:hypothetical protein
MKNTIEVNDQPIHSNVRKEIDPLDDVHDWQSLLKCEMKSVLSDRNYEEIEEPFLYSRVFLVMIVV